MSNDQPQLVMRRPNLKDLPERHCPAGYRLRHFRSGDEVGWNALMDVAFGRSPGESDFNRDMAASPAFRPERVWFITTDDNEIVATASSWHFPQYGDRTGYVHWVAAHPDLRGHRLGYWVSVAALHQAVRDGRLDEVLLTDDFRTAAIKTYLRLAFVPVLTHESHAQRWRHVLTALAWPEQFERVLAGPLVTFPLSNDS